MKSFIGRDSNVRSIGREVQILDNLLRKEAKCNTKRKPDKIPLSTTGGKHSVSGSKYSVSRSKYSVSKASIVFQEASIVF